MKKFLKWVVISATISFLITGVYYFIDFNLAGWFAHDLQFMIIPGFICIGIAVRLYSIGSVTSTEFFHINSASFKDRRDEMVEQNRVNDSRIPVMLALLLVGTLQLLLGFTIFNG